MKKLIYISIVLFFHSNLFGQGNEEKNNENAYQFAEEEAEFPGGLEAMVKYISENIKYPQTAVKKHIEGKCYVKFAVSEKGEIEEVVVVRGVPNCPECDEEAIRVVKAMPNWKPCKMNGKLVRTRMNLPINFTL